MKKALLSYLFLPLFCFTAYADELDDFLALDNITADFIQTNHYLGVEEYKRQGRVYIKRPIAALWDYPDSPAEFFLLEPQLVTHYSEELEQLSRLKVNKAAGGDAAAVILNIFLDGSEVRNRFNVDAKGGAYTFTPKEKLGVAKVVLTLKKGAPVKIFSLDEAGNTITIEFSKVKTNTPIPEGAFKKTVPKGTAVYEQ